MSINGTQAVKLPEEGSKISFKSLKNIIPCPFVIYADIEAILVPQGDGDCHRVDSSYTVKKNLHEACSFGYKVLCSENERL